MAYARVRRRSRKYDVIAQMIREAGHNVATGITNRSKAKLLREENDRRAADEKARERQRIFENTMSMRREKRQEASDAATAEYRRKQLAAAVRAKIIGRTADLTKRFLKSPSERYAEEDQAFQREKMGWEREDRAVKALKGLFGDDTKEESFNWDSAGKAIENLKDWLGQ